MRPACYAREAVAWTLGDPCLHIHGGANRFSGLQSGIGRCTRSSPPAAMPALARSTRRRTTTSQALFARDAHLCMYCGHAVHPSTPHPRPCHARCPKVARTAGKRGHCLLHCNSRRATAPRSRPACPCWRCYRPSWIEHLILSSRNILADQMAFPEGAVAQALETEHLNA
ncbi:hypothetical protein ACE0DR_28805 [Azotobacter sp. CWF10]